MVSEVSKDTVSASSEAVERLERALDIATKYTGGIEFGETSDGYLSFADLRALISTLRSQAEALEKATVERDLYRIVAVNQGWNWRTCDVYGPDEYQKHREAHVDECVAVALSHRSRAALTPEVKP